MPPEQRDPIPDMGKDLEENGGAVGGGGGGGGGGENEEEEAPSPNGGGGEGVGTVDISAVMGSVRTWVVHQKITPEFEVFCDLQGGPSPRIINLFGSDSGVSNSKYQIAGMAWNERIIRALSQHSKLYVRIISLGTRLAGPLFGTR